MATNTDISLETDEPLTELTAADLRNFPKAKMLDFKQKILEGIQQAVEKVCMSDGQVKLH